MICASNIRQLSLSWLSYADDNNDMLVNNHGVPETLARRQTGQITSRTGKAA